MLYLPTKVLLVSLIFIHEIYALTSPPSAFIQSSHTKSSSITTTINGIIAPQISVTSTRTQKTTSLFSSSSEESSKKPIPPPRDMNYIPTNIMRIMENYRNIRGVGGVETVNDVYVRDPETNVFWFAGKIARCTGTYCTCDLSCSLDFQNFQCFLASITILLKWIECLSS